MADSTTGGQGSTGDTGIGQGQGKTASPYRGGNNGGPQDGPPPHAFGVIIKRQDCYFIIDGMTGERLSKCMPSRPTSKQLKDATNQKTNSGNAGDSGDDGAIGATDTTTNQQIPPSQKKAGKGSGGYAGSIARAGGSGGYSMGFSL